MPPGEDACKNSKQDNHQVNACAFSMRPAQLHAVPLAPRQCMSSPAPQVVVGTVECGGLANRGNCTTKPCPQPVMHNLFETIACPLQVRSGGLAVLPPSLLTRRSQGKVQTR